MYCHYVRLTLMLPISGFGHDVRRAARTGMWKDSGGARLERKRAT